MAPTRAPVRTFRPRPSHLDEALWSPQMRAVRDGVCPAEALTTREREIVVWALVRNHLMTDIEIARTTRSTRYTVERIRDELGLAANIETDLDAPARNVRVDNLLAVHAGHGRRYCDAPRARGAVA